MLDSFFVFFTQFHFTQPAWLIALVALAFVYWLMFGVISGKSTSKSGWGKVIDPHLLPVLIKNNQKKAGKSFSILLLIAWLISVLALANPTWEKRSMPVFQTNAARVIVLDLSRSMEITDLKPSRLARARFKIEDILAKDEEGQTGLVVFAGDAFTVTPLTRDADTIRSLLKSLTPGIMPIQGSRADLGLLKAGELLEQAGVPGAQIILMADGAEAQEALDVAKKLNQKGYSISVLGIGTKAGAPIPKVQDRNGKPIIVGMQEDVLKDVADIGGGRYRSLSNDSTDIDSLMPVSKLNEGNKTEKNNDLQSKDWKSEGPWLVLLLLPLAAVAFRRGWLVSISLVVLVLGQPQPAFASVWESLWKRQDQQADLAFQAGNYEQAQQLSEDPLRRGSAAYKKGDYEQALNSFSEIESADGLYNKGNALTQLNKLEEAVKAYDQALELRPDMQDALDNKGMVEVLIEDRKKKEKQQNKKNKSDPNKDNKKQDDDSTYEKDKNGDESLEKDKNGDKSLLEEDRKGEQDDGKDSEKGQGKDDKDKESQQPEENQFAKANEQDKEGKEDKENEDGKQRAQQDGKDDKESADEKQQQVAKAGDETEDKEGKETDEFKGNKAMVSAETLNNEEKMAAEQWLRRIPDDPGGLLKRKFKYQYRRRGQRDGTGGQRPW